MNIPKREANVSSFLGEQHHSGIGTEKLLFGRIGPGREIGCNKKCGIGIGKILITVIHPGAQTQKGFIKDHDAVCVAQSGFFEGLIKCDTVLQSAMNAHVMKPSSQLHIGAEGRRIRPVDMISPFASSHPGTLSAVRAGDHGRVHTAKHCVILVKERGL